MTKALRKERKRHLDFIASLPIDEDAKNEAIQYILFLEKSKKEAEKVGYTTYAFLTKDTGEFIYQSFRWVVSKQDVSFWVYIAHAILDREEQNA